MNDYCPTCGYAKNLRQEIPCTDAWHSVGDERTKTAALVAALEGLLKGCEVYESAFDTDEGWTFYDGAKRHARRVLAESA